MNLKGVHSTSLRWLVLLILALLVLSCEPQKQANQSNASESPYVTLRLNYGNARPARVIDSLNCEENMTILALMKQVPDLQITEKTYDGIGTQITGIDGEQNDGDRFWVYCVNGSYASKAADKYTLSAGDQVSWYLTDDSEPCE